MSEIKSTETKSTGINLTENTYTLTATCGDKSGIIAAITDCIAGSGGNIVNLAQHTATDIGMFFCRVKFAGSGGAVAAAGNSGAGDGTETVASSKSAGSNQANPEAAKFNLDSFKKAFKKVGTEYNMDWHVFDNSHKKRVAVLVSKTSHCLYELLLKHADGELDCEIPVIISNHPDLAHVASAFHIPFFQVDTKKGKAEYESDLEEILHQYNIDLVVLARYMQVMSGDFCERWHNKCINIHHGFLPAFKGAKPYHQAWQKGVKIIGATGHIATEDLDQGPIIFQDVIRVNDTRSVAEFIRMGKDVERHVLYETVRRYLAHAVFFHEGRTFVIE